MHRNPPPFDVVLLRLDHTSPLVRAGVATLLAPHRERVRLLPRVTAEVADVVLFELPHQRDFRPYAPGGAPLVALLWDDSKAMRDRALRLGVAGVLPVGVRGEDLVEAVESAHRRATPTRVLTVVDRDPLSTREHEVIALICRGLGNEAIAEHLSLSVNSVKTYVRTAYRKMGVRSRAQAVIWGLAHGL